MTFAQFFHLSTGYIPGSIPPLFAPAARKPIPVCGSDGILYLDGRFNLERQALTARDICRQRGFIGFTLHKGESLLREKQTRKLELL